MGNDGFVKTVPIDSDGQIDSVVDTLEFDPTNGYEPDMIQVGGDFYGIAYSGSGNDGFLITIEIDAAGEITDTVIDSLEFDTSYCRYPDMLNVGGGLSAIAYSGPGWDGFLRTASFER